VTTRLSNQDNGVNILTRLGLTNRQADIYIAIVRLGQPTAKQIAQTLQIARAEVYRATAELQRRSLIKKIVATPTAFEAILLSDALSLLLERDVEKHMAMQKEAKQFLRNFKNLNREKQIHENSQYYLTTRLKTVERDYLRDLSEFKVSKDCILWWNVILSVVNRDFKFLNKALEKGVRIRYIANVPNDTKMPQIIRKLTKAGSFEVKFVSAIPKAGIDIFDKKIVHIITVATYSKIVEVLRSNNPGLLALAQDYFELKWQSATAPRWVQENIT
jgi:sugar-specific transcriptional regulator TrmB